jgi:hypothetical protein
MEDGDAAGRRPGVAEADARRIGEAMAFQPISLPALGLPRVELFRLSFTGAELADLSARWREAMAPLAAVGEDLRRLTEAWQATTRPLAERLRWVREQSDQCDRLERAGWLPHRTSPFHLLQDGEAGDGKLDRRVQSYYEEAWPEVASGLREGIEACRFDQEAKDCFSEALAAHGAGLYRCAPRLLFPEIERVARIELHGGSLEGMASQRRLVASIGHLTPAEMSSTGVTGLRFYGKLTQHLYQPVRDEDRVAAAAADPVPNRHAAIHGIVPYTSAKSSLNAVFVADYLLQAISTIRGLAEEEAGEGADPI